MAAHPRLRRAVRIMFWVSTSAVALTVVLALLLLLRPVREAILSRALDQARSALPGTLTAGEARWPGLQRLEFEDLVWTEGGDTLLAAEQFELSVKFLPLLRDDLHLNMLRVEGLYADLPKMQGRLGAEAAPPDTTGGGTTFPREGALPGLPSMAVDSLAMAGARVILPDSSRMVVSRAALSIDLLSGHRPVLRVGELQAQNRGQGWRVDETRLVLDAAAGRLEGTSTGRLTEDWPYRLAVSSEGDNRARLEIGLGDVAPASLVLDLRFLRDGSRLEAASFDLSLDTPSVEELARVPGLRESLADAPRLEGLRVTAEGRAVLRPEAAVTASLRLHENDWLESGRIDLRHAGGTTTADTLALALPDLLLTGRASMGGNGVRADLSLAADGMRWMDLLDGGEPPLDSLSAVLDLEISGSLPAPAVRAELTGGLRSGGFTLDGVELEARTEAVNRAPVDLSLITHARDVELATELTFDAGDTLVARFAPLRLRDLTSPGRRLPPGDRTGRVRFVRQTQTLTVADLRVTGDAGRFAIDAQRDSSGALRFAVNASWPEPPRLLTSRFALDEAALDSLRTAFRREGPFTLSASGRANPDTSPPVIEADGDFRLPGPATLSPLLPEGARVEGLGPLLATFSARTGAPGGEPAATGEPPADGEPGGGSQTVITADLGATEWLDVAAARVRLEGQALHIDSVRVALEGIRLEAEGSRRDSLWDADAALSVTDPRFVARFFPAFDDTLELGLEARARLHGPAGEPRLDAELAGHFSRGSLRFPAVIASGTFAGDSLAARVELPRGAAAGGFVVTGAEAAFRTQGDGILPARVAARLRREDMTLTQEILLRPGPGFRARVDRLALDYRGRDIASQQPFEVRFGGADTLARIEPFTLEGGLGTVTGEAFVDSSRVDLRVEADVALPEQPPGPVPDGLWPRHLALQARTQGRRDLSVTAGVEGLRLGLRDGLRLQIATDSGAEGFLATISLAEGSLDDTTEVTAGDDASGTVAGDRAPGAGTDTLRATNGEEILRLHAEIPLDLSLAPFSVELRRDSILVEARMNDLPLPLGPEGRNWTTERPAVVNGTARVDGLLGRPEVRAEAEVTFPDWPRLGGYRAAADLRLETGDAAAPAGSMASADLAANMTLFRDETSLLDAKASVPLVWRTDSLEVSVSRDRPLDIRVRSEELPLADFNPFLPPQIDMEGRLRVDLEATGPVGAMDLSGTVTAPEVEVSTAEGTRVAASASLELDGTSKRPTVSGRVEVDNGVIQIPEPSKPLHPRQGDAVLWRLAGDTTAVAADSAEAKTPLPVPVKADSAAADTAAAPADTAAVRREPPPDAPFQAEFDVEVNIPAALWIRGRGIDVELAGDLRLTQSGTVPTVAGDLRAVRGRMSFLGRTFRVERGLVTFYGDDEIDPELDIVMTARIAGTTVRVLVSGTAQDPRLTLSSDPEMPEGDIMSLVLFGRPLEELDNDQMTLLENRAAGVAANYASRELEARISRQLGVDVVTIQQGRDNGRSDALVIGKYLSPRALLKYEQALERGAGFFVNLEYLLTSTFKLETLVGPLSQSGVEVNWTRDY